MSQYIPYSIRNNITDKDLAGLLDYLEREMGWDIDYIFEPGDNIKHLINYDNVKSGGLIEICEYEYSEDRTSVWYGEERCVFTIPTKLFYSTYKSILPVIRDLYSK